MSSEQKKTYHILFVCTGNSCRSPMAEGLLKHKLPEKFDGKVVVRSAGTLGLEGNSATPFAITAAKERGVDISHHRSQGVEERLVKEADIIFAMAEDHKEYLERQFPRVRENVFQLKKCGRDSKKLKSVSIKDPMGGSMAVYRRCCREIDKELDRILPLLIRLIEDKLDDDERQGDSS
ncbi:MAG: low molecular weight protein arginine phosphatase [candidate division KSB1 bacterium]|nr:low molecular weight protein arginine phosphatase [candidate division KSB1 bacterium]